MKLLKSKIIICAMGVLLSTMSFAGDGAIPLRFSGRIFHSGDSEGQQRRFISNAQARITALDEESARNLKCLRNMPARRFLAKGQLNLAGSQHNVLAICLSKDKKIVEIYSTNVKTPQKLTRIIGRIRHRDRAATTNSGSEIQSND